MDESGDGPVVASTATQIGYIDVPDVGRLDLAPFKNGSDHLEVENAELRRRVESLEGYLYGERVDAGDGPLPDRVLELHERADGRWSAEIACTDGTTRWFRSALARPRQLRRPVPPKLRYLVFERDGFRCVYCGRSAPEIVLVIDHVIAAFNGGSDDPENLVAACRECNEGKGTRDATLTHAIAVRPR